MSQLVFDGESLITPEAIATELVSTKGAPYGDSFATAKARLALLLSIAKQQFGQARAPADIIHRLNVELHDMRRRLDPSVWQAIIPLAQNHPVAEFLHEDPFTRWSFEKPRGYSGDAQLLDFIYGHPSTAEKVAKASPLGRSLYDCTKASLSSFAVRERRDMLTRHVDEVAAARGPETEVLTIAAGHLREADRSVAFQERRIKRWVALDQDPLSVGSITRDFQGTCVDAIDGSVRGLLTNAYKLGRFDFVYAAGLYDYLPDNVAVKLTQRCLQLLKPNGIFLFANFSRDISDDGFMETFMNWALLLRSETDMWNIVNASVDRNTVEASVHFGANRNIVYGIIKKRS
ncbi:MAG: class I SAM-dependent methyltransferase [Pseudaminobacter sp.]|nr:class I SAM-dependent methyltransferase [Pseudaminobacter sp.]